MSESWPQAQLGDLVSKIGSGATPRGGKEVYVETGTAFIRSQNVYDNAFSFGGLVRITDDAAHELKGVSVQEGDVLVCITGESVTRTCLVDPAVLPARVSQHVAIVRPDPGQLDSGFLKAALLSAPIKNHLNRLSEAGATRRALTKSHLESLEIPLPPLVEQRRIAGVLGALDDLIETNQRLIGNLDDLAAAVFNRSIAVPDFGTSGYGPSFSPLSDLCSLRSGYAFKSSSWLSNGTPVLQIRNIGDGFIDSKSVKYVSTLTAEDAKKFVARTSDILVAMTGYVGSVSRVGAAEDGYLVNQRVGRIESIESSQISSEVLYRALRLPSTKEAMVNVANGSAQANLSAKDFGTITIAVPDLQSQAQIRPVLNILDSTLDELRLERNSLAQTRDELLPLLLSGRVSVREVAA
jgi:type I restriction enzyme S subunit